MVCGKICLTKIGCKFPAWFIEALKKIEVLPKDGKHSIWIIEGLIHDAVKNYCCFTRDWSKLAKCFRCKLCSRCFYLKSQLCEHTKNLFENSVYTSVQRWLNVSTIKNVVQFENITHISTPVETNSLLVVWHLICDTYRFPSQHDTIIMYFTNQHTTMPGNMCSNIFNFKNSTYRSRDSSPDFLVGTFVSYLEKLSYVAEQI